MCYITLVISDLLTDAPGVTAVINAGGVEVGAIVVAVTTVVEDGAGPGCGWQLELATVDGGGLGFLVALVLAVGVTTCVEGGVLGNKREAGDGAA